MKAATVKEIRDDLKHRSHKELINYCIRLANFKVENKELLTYLLFESENEEAFITSVKSKMDADFAFVNQESYYFAKKSIQKILRETKKFIRYSGKKEMEVELLLYFCRQLKDSNLIERNNRVVYNLYRRQLQLIEKRIAGLHEDLQYDFTLELKELEIPTTYY